MSTGWGRGRGLQVAAVFGLVVAYAGLSHYCNATGSREPGTALALAPLIVLSVAVARRWFPPPVATLLAVGAGVLLYLIRPLLERNFSLLYLTEENVVYGLLGLTFGRSLFGNRIALCTRLADKLHGPLSPREVWYTRRVTAAWSIFFFGICVLSLALYGLAPLAVWSICLNFCVLPLVGVMFATEYLVRQRVLPKATRGGLVDTVRVYFANPSR